MMAEKTAELIGLIDAVCEGGATAEQTKQLAGLLRGDKDAQWLYLRQVHMHVCLRWDLGAAAEYAAVQKLANTLRPVRRRTALRFAGWSLAVAASIALVVTLWQTMTPAMVEPLSRAVVVARLSHSLDAQWATDTAPSTGADLSAGTLRLRSGVARIDFPSGATVTMEGPAELQIDSERALLHSGQVTAHVPPQADKFHVHTSTLKVREQAGSTIGLAADDTATELSVFAGHVQVALVDDTPMSQRVDEGGAVRAAKRKPGIAAMSFSDLRFQKSWSVSWGVLAASGAVKFVEPGRHRQAGGYADDHHLVVFPEGDGIRLPRDVKTTVAAPGKYVGPFDSLQASVRGGTIVRAYLLQFNPIGGKLAPIRRLTGSITFDEPILGIIATSGELRASDELVHSDSPFAGRGGRGLEGGDAFELSPDLRTLHLDLTAAPRVDQLRVLVNDPPLTVASNK